MVRPNATGTVRLIAGKSDDALTCRFGATDRIEARILIAPGVYDVTIAQLPRETVSTPVDRSALAEGETPIWDDAFLPPVGTPLYARPMANAGGGRGLLAVDGTTLRPNA